MDIFIRHQLDEDESGFILTLYLAPDLTEFSKELTYPEDIKKNIKLYNSIEKYITDNLKNIKINTVKIMAGAMLVATIPFTSPAQLSAAPINIQASQSLNNISINFS